MTHLTPRAPVRLPAFHPVPLRKRRDGWTPLKQAEFIGLLAETGSVSKAAELVGMARESAYRLRTKPSAEEFVAAWDAALGSPAHAATCSLRKVTNRELWHRATEGIYQAVLRGGRYAGTRHKPDDSALLALVGRLGRVASPRPARASPGRRSHK